MAQINPGKAQTICNNIIRVKRSVGDIELSDLEQNTQQKKCNENDEDKSLVFIPKCKIIQRPCDKVTDNVKPKTGAEIFGKIQPADGGIIHKGKKCYGDKPCEKNDF